MKRIVKFIAWLAGILIVAVIALAIAVPLFFNPNDYKAQITAWIKDHTGRDVTIQGDINATVFPWVGLELNDVTVSNAPGFDAAPFAAIDTVHVRAKLLPLLKKELRMDTVTLRGAAFHLVKNKAGQTNWADLIPKEGGEQKGVKLAAIAVGGLTIDDAKLSWDDRTSGKLYVLDKFDLHSDALAPNQPFKVALEFDVQQPRAGQSAHVEARATGTLDLERERYQFNDTELSVTPSGKTLRGAGPLTLTGDVRADLQQQTLTLPALKLSGLGLNITGALQVTDLRGTPRYSGPLTIAPFNPRELLKRLGITPPAGADPRTLTRAQAQLQLAGGAQALSLQPLTLKLDDSTVSGALHVKNFSQPGYTFTLDVDTLDLDRYRAPTPPPAALLERLNPLRSAHAAAPDTALLPVALLRTLNARGTLRVGQLKASNLRLNAVQTKLDARGGLVKLQPLSAKLYDGVYSGHLTLDVRGKTPRVALDDTLTGVQAGALLKDLIDKDRITGKATVSAQLSAQGNSTDAWLQSLTGRTAFNFANGAVKGVNIAKLVREARAKLNNEPVPPDSGPNQTDFSELRGTGTLTNGVLHNEDLAAKSPLLRVTGQGDIDLVRESMDYLVKVSVVNTLTGEGGKEMSDLRGLTIPVKISGPFENLSYRPDIEAMLSDTAKTKVQEKIDERRQEIEQDLQEKLQDKLKGLFQ